MRSSQTGLVRGAMNMRMSPKSQGKLPRIFQPSKASQFRRSEPALPLFV